MNIINKFLEINNNWKKKYNALCIFYTDLANERIKKLEEENEILLKNIRYRDLIDQQKDEITRYRRKYGKLKRKRKGGDKNAKNKGKRKK